MANDKVTRIVVGYDYSPIAELALKRGFDLASNEEHGEVHVVTVIMLGDGTGAGIAGLPVHPTISLSEAHGALKDRVQAATAAWQQESGKSFDRIVTHIRSEAPAAEIAQLATDLEARLIVVGTHGRRGVQRLLLGSVAEGVVRMAHCEVLVVRPHDTPAPVPKIEPPCPRCVEARNASAGKELWCEQHRERHGQRHTYHYESRVAREGNITGPTSTRT
jgi:nucleotide-binding universal stress UspA family protein